MSENEFEDFIACVPQKIGADWCGKWGSLLAGFPIKIIYALAPRESEHNGVVAIITACYEPALATFRETKKNRALTYFNPRR